VGRKDREIKSLKEGGRDGGRKRGIVVIPFFPLLSF